MPKGLTLVASVGVILLGSAFLFAAWGFGYTAAGLAGHTSEAQIAEIEDSANLALLIFVCCHFVNGLIWTRRMWGRLVLLSMILRYLGLVVLSGLASAVLALVILSLGDSVPVRNLLGFVSDAVKKLASVT